MFSHRKVVNGIQNSNWLFSCTILVYLTGFYYFHSMYCALWPYQGKGSNRIHSQISIYSKRINHHPFTTIAKAGYFNSLIPIDCHCQNRLFIYCFGIHIDLRMDPNSITCPDIKHPIYFFLRAEVCIYLWQGALLGCLHRVTFWIDTIFRHRWYFSVVSTISTTTLPDFLVFSPGLLFGEWYYFHEKSGS